MFSLRTAYPDCLTVKVPKMEKKIEFANNVDPDKVAHNEPPHPDLRCLPLSC